VEIEAHKSQKQIQDQLNHEIKSTTYKVKKIMHNVNPRRVKEIHKFRIQAKKLRYQQECLNSLVGNSRFDLQNLTLVQSVAGRIQNDSVLLKTLDRYLAKKGHHHDRAANKIRRRVKVNRTKIINTDFAKLNAIKWQN
jgi:CHAD domain-containing protein